LNLKTTRWHVSIQLNTFEAMRDKTKKVTTVVSKVIIDLNFNEYHTWYLENL